MGYNPESHKELDMTEVTERAHTYVYYKHLNKKQVLSI